MSGTKSKAAPGLVPPIPGRIISPLREWQRASRISGGPLTPEEARRIIPTAQEVKEAVTRDRAQQPASPQVESTLPIWNSWLREKE